MPLILNIQLGFSSWRTSKKDFFWNKNYNKLIYAYLILINNSPENTFWRPSLPKLHFIKDNPHLTKYYIKNNTIIKINALKIIYQDTPDINYFKKKVFFNYDKNYLKKKSIKLIFIKKRDYYPNIFPNTFSINDLKRKINLNLNKFNNNLIHNDINLKNYFKKILEMDDTYLYIRTNFSRESITKIYPKIKFSTNLFINNISNIYNYSSLNFIINNDFYKNITDHKKICLAFNILTNTDLESSFWVLNSDYFKRRGFYDLTKFNLNESNLILDYFVDIHFQNIYSHEVFLKRVFEKNYYRLIMTDTWYPNQKNIKRKLCFIKKFSYIEEIPLNIDIGSDENFFYIESKKKVFLIIIVNLI